MCNFLKSLKRLNQYLLINYSTAPAPPKNCVCACANLSCHDVSERASELRLRLRLSIELASGKNDAAPAPAKKVQIWSPDFRKFGLTSLAVAVAQFPVEVSNLENSDLVLLELSSLNLARSILLCFCSFSTQLATMESTALSKFCSTNWSSNPDMLFWAIWSRINAKKANQSSCTGFQRARCKTASSLAHH